ncbi:hypothetical protein [Polynucleobacter necessarius]|uniref:hypothetical protein n=1 Tax=Polynucleobacter necessarius TaxID=576610 RepID=UPI001E65C09B|nr:hypothetical protein [Polynucleobacter necessarius]
MSALLKKLDAHLPFNKSERIIICIVVLLHALPALEFLHLSSKPTPLDEERVPVNFVNPQTVNKPQQPPAATPPKPKEEKKVAKEKPAEKPSPNRTPQVQQTPPAQNPAAK